MSLGVAPGDLFILSRQSVRRGDPNALLQICLIAVAVSESAVEVTEEGLRLTPSVTQNGGTGLSQRHPRQHPSANLTNNLGGQIRSHLSSPRAFMRGQGGQPSTPSTGLPMPPASPFVGGEHSPAWSTWMERQPPGPTDSFRTI